MTKEQKRKAVIDTLNYMIDEGMIVRTKKGYRLKTELELKREMEELLHEQ